MKTDRLYALTLYLLNHGKTPASELAERFEVSIRTIQRDIDTLCQAGIPIYAVTGINGGYDISDTFKINNHLVSKEEFSYIATALQGLKTVTNSRLADEILEKIIAISNPYDTTMVLDFSVLREGDEKLLQALQSAAINRHTVKFSYTNNKGETKLRHVEPVTVMYKWYSWYMLAYDKDKEDYRTYKLVRMENISVTEETFTRSHISVKDILDKYDNLYTNKTLPTKVILHCYNHAIHRIKEYLNGKITKIYENGSALVEVWVIEDEQWWVGVIMSQGKDAEVLEPEHIKSKIIDSAKDLLYLYKKL
ncbi:YafY family protein [Lachnospiraceae bacterium 48-33]